MDFKQYYVVFYVVLKDSIYYSPQVGYKNMFYMRLHAESVLDLIEKGNRLVDVLIQLNYLLYAILTS